MTSPEDRNRIRASSSFLAGDDVDASPSPTIQESPFLNFLRNLSPIKSSKAEPYAQRFSLANFSTPPPVFSSPRIDLQKEIRFLERESPQIDLRKETRFLERDEKEVAGLDLCGDGGFQMKPGMVSCFQKKVQSGSPSRCIYEFLADTVKVNDTVNSADVCSQLRNDAPNLLETGFNGHKKTIAQGDDTSFVKREANLSSSPIGANLENAKTEFDAFLDTLFREQEHKEYLAEVSQVSELQPADVQQETSFSEPLQRVAAYEDLRTVSRGSVEVADQYQRGIHRHIQFGAAMSLNLSCYKTCDTVNLNIPFSLPTFGGQVQPNVELHTSPSIGGGYADLEDEQNNTQVTGTPVTSLSTNCLQDPCDSLHVAQFRQQVVSCEGKTATSQNDMFEDSTQLSLEKNRTRAINTSDSESCKRCNCKRSKCLKLYCECFAAGIYCLDTCACKGCFNKPEYEDTVLDTRQQIENRNPLAFAPKVIKEGTKSPVTVVKDGIWATPSSSRHKRGCNCKKSKCVKKYCECFQAGVGCSDGCRCEGCGNAFGKKTEFIYRRTERRKNLSQEQLETLETQTNCIKGGQACHSSPSWEELADLSHLTSSSRPHIELSSSSLNVKEFKYSGAQLHDGSNLHSSSNYLKRCCSPTRLGPNLYERKVLAKLSFNLLHDFLREGDTPEMLKNASTSLKAVKARSPNQNQMSPPQVRSQEWSSSSLQGLKCGRKFILQAVPSFPPLTPYSNKENAHEVDAAVSINSQW